MFGLVYRWVYMVLFSIHQHYEVIWTDIIPATPMGDLWLRSQCSVMEQQVKLWIFWLLVQCLPPIPRGTWAHLIWSDNQLCLLWKPFILCTFWESVHRCHLLILSWQLTPNHSLSIFFISVGGCFHTVLILLHWLTFQGLKGCHLLFSLKKYTCLIAKYITNIVLYMYIISWFYTYYHQMESM